MNYGDWYTDLMEIRRVCPVAEGSLTRHERAAVAENVPCRVYRSGVHAPRMQPTAARSEGEDKLACGSAVDIQAGDELIIRRGGLLGKPGPVLRAFAGEPVGFYEPFGAVLPGLAHQEVGLLQQEYLKGGTGDGAGRGPAPSAGGAGEAGP